MKLDLIMNGVNLGMGVLGNAASVASFASGFSLEKDIQSIKKSVSRLDDMAKHIKNLDKGVHHTNSILKGIQSNIHVFKEDDFTKQQLTMQELFRQYNATQSEIIEERKFVLEALQEMWEIVKSVRYTEGNKVPFSESFGRTILSNPFTCGIHSMTPFVDISDLASKNIAQRIVNNNISPILWNNSLGQTFYGSISNSTLKKHGIYLSTPSYAEMDGHIFSDHYGFYVPRILAL